MPKKSQDVFEDIPKIRKEINSLFGELNKEISDLKQQLDVVHAFLSDIYDSGVNLQGQEDRLRSILGLHSLSKDPD